MFNHFIKCTANKKKDWNICPLRKTTDKSTNLFACVYGIRIHIILWTNVYWWACAERQGENNLFSRCSLLHCHSNGKHGVWLIYLGIRNEEKKSLFSLVLIASFLQVEWSILQDQAQLSDAICVIRSKSIHIYQCIWPTHLFCVCC